MVKFVKGDNLVFSKKNCIDGDNFAFCKMTKSKKKITIIKKMTFEKYILER